MNAGIAAFLGGECEDILEVKSYLNFQFCHVLSVGSWPINLAYFCLRP